MDDLGPTIDYQQEWLFRLQEHSLLVLLAAPQLHGLLHKKHVDLFKATQELEVKTATSNVEAKTQGLLQALSMNHEHFGSKVLIIAVFSACFESTKPFSVPFGFCWKEKLDSPNRSLYFNTPISEQPE